MLAFDALLGSQVKKIARKKTDNRCPPRTYQTFAYKSDSPEHGVTGLQAAQQGDATKVDKRRKKKQKEQAEDEAFLDNEQDDGEYEQGKSGQPSAPAFACLLEPSTLNNSNFDSLLTALPLLGFATELLYTLSAVLLAQ